MVVFHAADERFCAAWRRGHVKKIWQEADGEGCAEQNSSAPSLGALLRGFG